MASLSAYHMAWIIALEEDVQPSEYCLVAAICTIGRSPLCEVVVSRSTVSRLHAKIERNGSRCVLVDIGSANGTFINGLRIIEPQVLADLDLIGLGMEGALLGFVRTCPVSQADQACTNTQPEA